ncbi:MAG: hypothetical protein E3J72_04655 [Planctomycetota bacterium]|nr:MAG: hypothetical protein E3J72_04655 [Planctomycetota bacterium]
MEVLRNARKEIHFVTELVEITPELMKSLTKPICFIAIESEINPAAIEDTLRTMLIGGAMHFYFYGPNASVVHAWVDSISYEVGLNEKEDGSDLVLTVGENNEEMEESIWDFFCLEYMSYDQEWSYLAFAIGSEEFMDKIKNELENVDCI